VLTPFKCIFSFFLQDKTAEAIQEENERLKAEIEKLQNNLISREKVVCNSSLYVETSSFQVFEACYNPY
jgi:ABC-type Zn2+ transport system substrate-binding protein/surface adhesin